MCEMEPASQDAADVAAFVEKLMRQEDDAFDRGASCFERATMLARIISERDALRDAALRVRIALEGL